MFGDIKPSAASILHAADSRFEKVINGTCPGWKALFRDRNLLHRCLENYKYNCDMAYVAVVYHYSRLMGADKFPMGLTSWPAADSWIARVPEIKYMASDVGTELALEFDADDLSVAAIPAGAASASSSSASSSALAPIAP